MLTMLMALELNLMEKCSREQLIAELLEQRGRFSLDFDALWLNDQSTDFLRLLLLAAKLSGVLRQRQKSEDTCQCGEAI